MFTDAGESNLMRLSLMARWLGVTTKWLRAEAEAGRVPCVDADGTLLFDREVVERVLLARAGRELLTAPATEAKR